nr:protein G12-like [Onthophagus taurus]
MKFALVFFALMATCSAIPCTGRDLQQDFEDIIATIPLSQIKAIAQEHLENDGEFQEVVKYLQGAEWSNLVDTVADNPTWKRFKAYMDSVGVDVNGVIQYFHDLIAEVEISKCTDDVNIRSVKEFLDEIRQILDLSATFAILSEKLNTSPDFKEFFENISSEEAHAMVEEILALDEVQRIAERLLEMDIEVDKIIDLVYGLLGWSKQVVTRDYRSEIQDIVRTTALSRRDVSTVNAENAAEFLEIVNYLQGNEWVELVQKQRWWFSIKIKVCLNFWIVTACFGN